MAQAADIRLLNVSCDPARELHQECNTALSEYWKGSSGDNFTINDVFGGWQKAQKEHVSDGSTFDQIRTKK